MSNKVARKVYARFSSRFPRSLAHPSIAPLQQTEDPGGVAKALGTSVGIMGLTSIRTQSSFIPGHRADSSQRKRN